MNSTHGNSKKDSAGQNCEYESCQNEAKFVLRLISVTDHAHPEVSKLFFQRKCCCKEHAEYLCNDAPFKWENLPNFTVAQELEFRRVKA